MRTHFKIWLVVLVCGLLLLFPITTQGQEQGGDPTAAAAPAAEEEETPAGIGLAMLLLGLGGVVIVGGAMINRDNFQGDKDDNE